MPTSARRRSRLHPLVSWVGVLVLAGSLSAACSDEDGSGGTTASGNGDAVAVDGAEVFATNCAVCHGAEATGTAQGPPLAHDIYEPGHHPDESFRQAIASGVTPHHWDFGPMPPLQLTDAEVEAVIEHVRSVQREAGIID